MSILNLPNDLYRSIQGYTNINLLLNSSKKFDYAKYESYYWKLNKETSFKYYNHTEFRDIVNKKMCTISKQLSLNIHLKSRVLDILFDSLYDVIPNPYSNISFSDDLKNVHDITICIYHRNDMVRFIK